MTSTLVDTVVHTVRKDLGGNSLVIDKATMNIKIASKRHTRLQLKVIVMNNYTEIGGRKTNN